MLQNMKSENARVAGAAAPAVTWRPLSALVVCAVLLAGARNATAAQPPAFAKTRGHTAAPASRGRAVAPGSSDRAAAPAPSSPAATPAVVERVRYTAEGKSTRVIVMLSRAVPYEVRILPGESARGSERRLVLDF